MRSAETHSGGDGHRITDVCWVGALADDAGWTRTRDEAGIFQFGLGHGAAVCPRSDGRGRRRPGLRRLLLPVETPDLPGTALAHTLLVGMHVY
jgi:hypothetical protein